MVRVIRFHAFGGPDVLKIEDVQLAPVAPDEVRIKVRAIGINRADILIRSGSYIETPTLPSGLGLEAAGVVESVGSDVVDIEVGDVVSAIPPISMVRWPAYGEMAAFPANHIVKHPPEIDFVTAAGSWMAYLTAYGALVQLAQLRTRERVLITAASSSVGLAAIEIANSVGAIPIAVTRDERKRQVLLDAGAHQVLTSYDAVPLMGAGGKAGFRVVFDPIGGPAFDPITSAMAHGGILLEYGGLSRQPTPFPIGSVLAKCLTLRGYLVHELVRDVDRLGEAKDFIIAGLRTGKLKLKIAKIFPFEQIAEAHAYLERNEHVGKVVVTL